MTLAEVRALRGPQGERIATLAEALALPRPIIHEFKQRGIEAELAAAIAHRRDDIVSSFDHASLELIHTLDPEIKLGYLWFAEDWRDVIVKAAATGAHSIHPSNYDVCPEMVDMARAHGLAVHVWSVGDAVRADMLAAWGVDGIMTYAPGETRRRIGQARAAA